MDTDALLQASRRLDWRFLLPHPELGHVGYLGAADDELFESLRLFSAAITRIDLSSIGGGSAAARRYDVVVLSDPSYEDLAAAPGLLRPGGSLYLEGRRHLSPLARSTRVSTRTEPQAGEGGGRVRVPRLGSAADYMQATRRLSLVDVRAYWHWPDFERCAEIVPLDDQAALLHALSRRRSAGIARIKAKLGRSLVKLDYMERLAPCFSIVGQRPDLSA